MVELRDEVTQVRAATIMVDAWATWAEKMTQENVVLLSSTHGEASEVAWKVSLLEGELTVACQARDTAEAKLLGLIDGAADTDQRRDESEG